MHILLVNDDGPPGDASPFVSYLVDALKARQHKISVCLPHTQRSWIGKAHMIGEHLTPTYYRPETSSTHTSPRTDGGEEWVLLDGTPASCTQVGLHHLFQESGEIDLVISGPNLGRNSTAVFALSSGTLGGAMEASVAGYKAIAISYAYSNRQHDWDLVKKASEKSVQLVEYLYKTWPTDRSVDLFSINVPLEKGVDSAKSVYTHILQNSWSACYQEIQTQIDEDADEDKEELKIREGGNETPNKTKTEPTKKKMRKQYKWSPKFVKVTQSVENGGAGSDGWALKEGKISVTGLKANFMHAPGLFGEIKLDEEVKQSEDFYALVDYSDDRKYVEPLIKKALSKYLPQIKTIKQASELPSPDLSLLTWASYESLEFEELLSYPTSRLFNAYIIRKALIRKHYLLNTIQSHIKKNPESCLVSATPLSVAFEVDYPEFLDEALVEEYELLESLQRNESKSEEEREYWILKPGMSDRGIGIRLFGTMEELQAIFESFEEPSDDEDEDDDETDMDAATEKAAKSSTGIVTSQLRHFVAQQYIPPLLLKPNDGAQSKKFHIRTYILAIGGLKVYVYKPMLALFSSTPYATPQAFNEEDAELDLSAHLTNTCLQSGVHDGSVRPFWSLPDTHDVTQHALDKVFKQVCDITGEVFAAALGSGRIHFQPVPNAFEIFGLDYLVDEDQVVKILEVNAFPDFKQTGEELSGLVAGLFDSVVEVGVKDFFGLRNGLADDGDLVKVLDVDVGKF